MFLKVILGCHILGFPIRGSIDMGIGYYIINQKEHHKKVTFLEEYDEFIKSFPKFSPNKKP